MMKYITLLALTMGIAPSLYSNATLMVEVDGFKTAEGLLQVALYTSKETFLRKSWMHGVDTIDPGSLTKTIIFHDIPPGRYAVAVVHDLDENGELTTNFMGIPKEPVGVSNNAKGRFGPPSFEAAVFEVIDGENVTSIHLNKR